MKNETWIVIPAYNEDKTIRDVLQKVKKYIANIIVVDDGSKDKTNQVSKSERVIVLRHVVNLGKGAALKTGCDYAIKKGAKVMVVMDADAQHKPDKIPEFLEAIKDHDIVFGYRELNKTMPFILKFGNWFINKITSILYKIYLKDTQSGFRCFTAEAYKKIRWDAIDYSMESEMIANVGKQRLKYTEVPIQTIYADRYKGTTVLDGIKIVLRMIWWRLTR